VAAPPSALAFIATLLELKIVAPAKDSFERERTFAAAKYTVGTTGVKVAEESIQFHGGIGMTEELAASQSAKRLMMIDHQLGDADHHLQRYIELGAAA
jgi:alkylation response protein AidB-like acyl-CoA dehydrogenase